MNNTTGSRLPLPRALFEPRAPWRDTDQKQLLQFPRGIECRLLFQCVLQSRSSDSVHVHGTAPIVCQLVKAPADLQVHRQQQIPKL